MCIKSNDLELYDDLIASIETGKNYLVFVDDANELTGLHLVLNTDYSEMLHLDYQVYEACHKEQVQNLVKQYGLQKFRYLLQVCKECLEVVDREGRSLSSGVEYAMEAFSKNQELYVDAVNEYLNFDTPYGIRARRILHNLFKIMPAEDVQALIESHDFSQKSIWLWDFYVELPTDQISSFWAKDFLKHLENVPQHIRASPYRPLDEMEKF